MTTPAHLPLLAVWLDKLLSALVILLTGAHAQPLPQLRERTAAGRIYYANHNSHGDFMLIWVSLPRVLRRQLRPVAAAGLLAVALAAVTVLL